MTGSSSPPASFAASSPSVSVFLNQSSADHTVQKQMYYVQHSTIYMHMYIEDNIKNVEGWSEGWGRNNAVGHCRVIRVVSHFLFVAINKLVNNGRAIQARPIST